MRRLLSSVTARIVLAVVLVVGIAGAALELAVLRGLVRHAEDGVERQLRERRDDLLRVCTDAYADLLQDGHEAGGRRARVEQARVLGRIEDYAAAHGLRVTVEGGDGREVLAAGPLPASGAQEIELTFEPWRWRIRMAGDRSDYASVIGLVRRTHLLGGAVLLLAAAALALALDRAVAAPLRAAASALAQKRIPAVRGAGEVRLLTEALAGALRELERERRSLETAVAALARAQETARLGSWEWDAASGAVTWSAQVRSILAIPDDALPSIELLLSAVHPDDRGRVAGAVQGLRAGTPFELEHRVARPDGAARTVVSRGEVTARENGRPVRLTGTIHDVSERRQIEEELRRARNLESLGLLAGGIAHDFNNLLAVLLGNVELARELLPQGSPARLHLEQAGKAHDLAQRLTGQFITFARGGAPERRRVNLAALIEDAVRFSLSGSAVRCDFRFPSPPAAVDVDPGQMTQVFQNLAVNAREAMPAAGTVSVGVDVVRLGPADPLPLPPGSYVLVTFGDTGGGIPAALMEDIFTPYFSTKSDGKRSRGLGLTTCHSIVKRHGGHIHAESTEGAGTVFRIWLPGPAAAVAAGPAAAAGAPGTARDRAVPPATPGARLRVLVMDDDVAVREVAVAYLHTRGFAVVATADGAAAVAAYREAAASESPFDAAVLDLVVPGGVGGEEAAAAIRALDPDARIVFASGYAERARAAAGAAPVLAKPYPMRALAEAVARVAGRGGQAALTPPVPRG